MKNRLFRSLLTGVVGACTLFVGSLTAIAAEFPDVSSGAWYYPYVQDVSEKGLMGGYSDGRFGPNDKLTRGQFATVLWRMSGSPDMGYSSFPDVPASSFYAKASEWARSEGVITGYSDGRFGGNDDINREQVATILYRYSGGEASGNIWEFPDAGSVSTFAKEGMSYAVGNGIISGDNGKLNPQGTVVRAVAATMISRYNNTSDNKPSGGGNEDKPAKHEHTWKTVNVPEQSHIEHIPAVTEQVWVPNIVTITDQEAWTETKPVYNYILQTICSYCGANISSNAYEHQRDHLENGIAAGYHDDWREVQVGTETINHPAVTHTEDRGHYETKTISEARDEKVIDVPASSYKECTGCGARN